MRGNPPNPPPRKRFVPKRPNPLVNPPLKFVPKRAKRFVKSPPKLRLELVELKFSFVPPLGKLFWFVIAASSSPPPARPNPPPPPAPRPPRPPVRGPREMIAGV